MYIYFLTEVLHLPIGVAMPDDTYMNNTTLSVGLISKVLTYLRYVGTYLLGSSRYVVVGSFVGTLGPPTYIPT